LYLSVHPLSAQCHRHPLCKNTGRVECHPTTVTTSGSARDVLVDSAVGRGAPSPHVVEQLSSIRGGGIWGKSKPREDSDEYEYEYDDEEDGGDTEDGSEEGEEWDDATGEAVDDEHYEDEEYLDDSSGVQMYGRVQDIDGQFSSGEKSDLSEDVDDEEMEDVEGKGGESNEGEDRNSFWTRGKGLWGHDGGATDTEGQYEELYEEYDNEMDGQDNNFEEYQDSGEDEDEDFSLNTLLPLNKGQRANNKAGGKFRFRSMKAPSASKPQNVSRWGRDPKVEDKNTKLPLKNRNNKSSADIVPRPHSSSSKASFITPLVGKIFSMAKDKSSRSFSTRSSSLFGGKSLYSKCITPVTNAVTSIIRPFVLLLQSVANKSISHITKWISFLLALVRASFDVLWYGQVDGVTTTGISRGGGLSSFLMSYSIMMAASSIFLIGIMTLVMMPRRLGVTDGGIRRNRVRESFQSLLGGRRGDGHIEDEDEGEYSDSDDESKTPTVEEELEFLQSFDSANPASKDRVSRALTGGRLFSWPTKPKSQKVQRQRSVRSIQSWWKQRPSSKSIAMIESQHIQNQQPASTQQISRLQGQLAKAEHERELLQSDVQRLQNRLQKAHHDARSLVNQNQWLEKQQSRADRILMKAVEVERRKANEEMERVRDTMKGVLERERMLMRGTMAERMAPYESNRQIKIERRTPQPEEEFKGLIEEMPPMDEEEDESDDMIWGGRMRSIHRNSNM